MLVLLLMKPLIINALETFNIDRGVYKSKKGTKRTNGDLKNISGMWSAANRFYQTITGTERKNPSIIYVQSRGFQTDPAECTNLSNDYEISNLKNLRCTLSLLENSYPRIANNVYNRYRLLYCSCHRITNKMKTWHVRRVIDPNTGPTQYVQFV